MHRLKTFIAARRDELRRHRLFERIAACRSAAPLAAMARALAWWPMVFQDVLRLNAERVRGSSLEGFAEHHRREDAGHDRWYLEDLRAFGLEAPGLDELFGEGYRPIRDACYALVHEVLLEQPAARRVVMLLALEPTAQMFFEQVTAATARCCPELPLRYFAHHHLGVEQDHELYAEPAEADLERIVLSDLERARTEAAVARVYDTFADIFSYLADRMDEATARRSATQERHIAPARPSSPRSRRTPGQVGALRLSCAAVAGTEDGGRP